MENLWKDSDAKAAIASHAAKGINEDLALRVYTTLFRSATGPCQFPPLLGKRSRDLG